MTDPTKIYLSPVEKDNIKQNSAIRQLIESVAGNASVYKISTLPSPTQVIQGARAMVTDSNITTFASTPTTGGTSIVPVYFDGTTWRIG